jgi:hypothetical protein
MTRLEELLLGHLLRHCRGAARARKIWRIAEDLAALGIAEATPRAVQEAIASLRLQCLPVGTTCGEPGGAFLCETPTDYRRAYRNLYGRMRAQARGCRQFHRAFREATSGQARFPFSEAQAAYETLVAAPLLAGLEVKA